MEENKLKDNAQAGPLISLSIKGISELKYCEILASPAVKVKKVKFSPLQALEALRVVRG
jgi:hypothetical protein